MLRDYDVVTEPDHVTHAIAASLKTGWRYGGYGDTTWRQQKLRLVSFGCFLYVFFPPSLEVVFHGQH